MEMQKEWEDRNMSQAMSTSTGNVTKVWIKFVEKEERKQKGGHEYRTEQKTRSARLSACSSGIVEEKYSFDFFFKLL